MGKPPSPLECFFSPKSVAVIGASRTAGKIGNVILSNFVREFRGKIYAVNPAGGSVFGLPLYPNIKSVKENIDLAIIAIPALAVPKALAECGQKKVPCVTIISAGFHEVGNEKLSRELEKVLKQYPKTKVMGPNCVEGKTPVLITNDAHSKFFEIGELVDYHMAKNAGQVVDSSGTEVLDCGGIGKKLAIASSDGSEPVYKPIRKLFRRKSAEAMRVHIESGKSLVCSPDHPFIVRQNGKLAKIAAKNIRVGMEVPLSLKLPQSTNYTRQIDLIAEFQKLEADKIEKLRLIEEGKYRPFSDTSAYFKKENARITTKKGRISLPAILQVNEALCKLTGYFLADGNYKRNCLQIGFVKDKTAERELRNYINQVFQSNVDLSKEKEIKFGRRIGKLVFQEVFDIKGHAETKAVPQFVFSSEPKQIAAFLSGLLSGDGGVHIFKKLKKASLYYDTTSEKMANQVMTLLSILGVGPFYFTRKERKNHIVKGKKWNALPLFEIRSDSKQAMAALYNLGFRFIGREKQEKLEKIVKERLNFKSRVKNGRYFRKITSIEKLPQKTTLYDFEVEDTHNFFAGQVLTSNCLGVLDSKSGVDMLFLPTERLERPRKGTTSFISQSGALGSAILDWDAWKGYGINKFVSYGNATALDESDLLEYLSNDSSSKVVVAYVEGVKNGSKFFKACQKIASTKPFICIKGGQSAEGGKAATSHTASMAGNASVYRGVFQQTNVVEAHSMEEVFDCARIFSTEPASRGNKVQIITDGGGHGVLAADAIAEAGLKLAQMKAENIELVKKVSPSYAVLKNPMDLTGDADNARYKAAIEATLKDENVDMVLLIVLFQVPALDEKIVQELTVLLKNRSKPVAVVSAGGKFSETQRQALEDNGISTFTSPEAAVKSLKALHGYYSKKKKPTA